MSDDRGADARLAHRIRAGEAEALGELLGDATTFAVTVESERVDAPTSDPVLVASLEG